MHHHGGQAHSQQQQQQSWKRVPATMCANCGKYGHVYKSCNHPVTSYGIICYRVVPAAAADGNNAGGAEVLLVQRRDSLAYVEFIRGKYTLENVAYMVKLLSHMTVHEQDRLCGETFQTLWRNLWQIESFTNFRAEYENSRLKFDHLQRGYNVIDPSRPEGDATRVRFVSVAQLVISLRHSAGGVDGMYQETEWGFPKGRRNIGETDHDCALREFFEETGMPPNVPLTLLDGPPLEEVFCGSNGTRYRHVYYMLLLPGELEQTPHVINSREVNKVAWFPLDDAKEAFRPYNVERRALIDVFRQRLLQEA